MAADDRPQPLIRNVSVRLAPSLVKAGRERTRASIAYQATGRILVMKYMKRRLFGLFASSAVLLPITAWAADVKDRTIKFGYSVHEVHPLGQGANKFVQLVGEKSGGKIKVRPYPATQLGSETQMISATQGGVQEMVGVSSAP